MGRLRRQFTPALPLQPRRPRPPRRARRRLRRCSLPPFPRLEPTPGSRQPTRPGPQARGGKRAPPAAQPARDARFNHGGSGHAAGARGGQSRGAWKWAGEKECGWRGGCVWGKDLRARSRMKASDVPGGRSSTAGRRSSAREAPVLRFSLPEPRSHFALPHMYAGVYSINACARGALRCRAHAQQWTCTRQRISKVLRNKICSYHTCIAHSVSRIAYIITPLIFQRILFLSLQVR